MSQIIPTPPVAFLLYLALVATLVGFGRVLAGATQSTVLKSSTYAGGEVPPARPASPGYQRFFVIALFFAVLHLGVLVFGSGGLSLMGGIYLAGLLLVLAALILG